MNFEEHVKRRMKMGNKFKGTPEHWKNWPQKKFIENAKEELVDCYNYLNNVDSQLTHYIMGIIKYMYEDLDDYERYKKNRKDTKTDKEGVERASRPKVVPTHRKLLRAS